MVRQKRNRLLAPFQEQILGILLLRPEREWYRSELARVLGVPASSLQRPLAGLIASGVLRARADGNRVYYRADTSSPVYPELRGLLVKTTGLVEVLREALKPLTKKITVALVYGSIATGEEASSSDVDLLVVGKTGLSELSPILGKASSRLGREVNPSVLTDEEFAVKLRAKNRFLRSVLDKPKLYVVGTEDDLRGVAGAQADLTGSD